MTWQFKASLIDSIGFIFLLLVATIPLYLISFIIAVFNTGQGMAFINTAIFTALYFYLLGKKLIKFISLFVNYQLSIKFYCKKCEDVLLLKEYPDDSETVK